MADQNEHPVQSLASAAAYPALFEGLLAEVNVTLADEERAYFDGRIDEATAQRDGATIGSAGVLDACLGAARTALPFVMAGAVSGFGPLRMRYALELGRALAGHVGELDATVVDAAGAGAARKSSLRGSREDRRAALRALKNLAGRNAEQRARVREVGKGHRERADERARSLGAIAKELEEVVAKAPPRVAEDAGATEALMQRLRDYARAVLEKREKAKDTRGSVGSRYDAMNVLDGRLLVELRALEGAMRDARKGNKAIPALRVGILRRSRRKVAKTEPAAAQGKSGSGGERAESVG